MVGLSGQGEMPAVRPTPRPRPRPPAALPMLLFPSQMKCGNCGEVSDKWQYLRLMVTCFLPLPPALIPLVGASVGGWGPCSPPV